MSYVVPYRVPIKITRSQRKVVREKPEAGVAGNELRLLTRKNHKGDMDAVWLLLKGGNLQILFTENLHLKCQKSPNC